MENAVSVVIRDVQGEMIRVVPNLSYMEALHYKTDLESHLLNDCSAEIE